MTDRKRPTLPEGYQFGDAGLSDGYVEHRRNGELVDARPMTIEQRRLMAAIFAERREPLLDDVVLCPTCDSPMRWLPTWASWGCYDCDFIERRDGKHGRAGAR